MVKVPLLSIIIPNYNSGQLLEVSLRSIFEKKCEVDFEVLIIDNCSIDSPDLIIAKFPAKCINFFSEADSGIYDAMNKGISISKGEWLYFLGSGDRFYIEKLNYLHFSKENQIVYGNVFHEQLNRVYDGRFSLLKLLKKNISHQALFYRKEILTEIQGFDTSFIITADYVINLRLFFNPSIKVGYSDEVFASYRGFGASEKIRDIKFKKEKNKEILKLLIKYPTIYNISSVLGYFLWLTYKKIRYVLKINGK